MSYHEKLAKIDTDLKEVDSQLKALKERRRHLAEQRDQIQRILQNRSIVSAENKDAWENSEFDWTARTKQFLSDVFKMSEFRPLQRSAINAVLSREDVILIMSTGGGKSLCYQLPALVSPPGGITLVVSPLISLMEDQVMALKKFGISAAKLAADSTKDQVNWVQGQMTDKDPKSVTLKVLYATPEKLAKSKRFMSKLEKMYQLGRFHLICIDEVHCCSQWGHDFRTDFAFLNVLKKQFPKVPIIGLTATATEPVVEDVKEMLNIPNALVFRAPLNRDNLHYEVHRSPDKLDGLADNIAKMCRTLFNGESGIVYCFSRKDTEEMTKALIRRGVTAATYHAYVEPEQRFRVHEGWISGQYQVIVATVAFGMGIDKPDVRFVIHASLSKSLENYYQESGRAGRDGKPAKCILFYRFADIFRQSSMVCTEKTGTQNLYAMVAYCHGRTECRRKHFALHFGEDWDASWCNARCDVCANNVPTLWPPSKGPQDPAEYLPGIRPHLADPENRITPLKLLELWNGKSNSAAKMLTKSQAEHVIVDLLLTGDLREEYHFTPYNIVVYVVCTQKAAAKRKHVCENDSKASSSSLDKAPKVVDLT